MCFLSFARSVSVLELLFDCLLTQKTGVSVDSEEIRPQPCEH